MDKKMLILYMVYMLINSSQTTYIYSSSKLNIPSVPTAFQQIGKLTSNLGQKMNEKIETEKCECGGIDWTTIVITMVMTVLSFWIGQFGMSFASHCSGWINQALIKSGCKKDKKKRKKKKGGRRANVAGKFCVFPIKRNKQLVAHIREPLRSKTRS